MINAMRCSVVIFSILGLCFTVSAAHHEGTVDEQMLEEAQHREELLNQQAESLAAETPLISPSSGAIDRYSSETSYSGDGKVARSAFAMAVIDREPVDEVAVVTQNSVYYFTDIRGMEGETVRHRWIYEGEVMADVEFTIGGPRWRVWSKKALLPRWSGRWTVSVVDESGAVLQSEMVQYNP